MCLRVLREVRLAGAELAQDDQAKLFSFIHNAVTGPSGCKANVVCSLFRSLIATDSVNGTEFATKFPLFVAFKVDRIVIPFDSQEDLSSNSFTEAFPLILRYAGERR